MTAGALGWSGPAAHTIAELLGRCTFPVVGTPVTCAVSGGADSTALAVLAVAAGCAVTIAHVDHGLRPTSAADAAAVAQLAAQLGVPYTLHTVHVGAGPNLEARARAARYGALPADVLTGHTADDQAETMLINLLRGAATSGLAASANNCWRESKGLDGGKAWRTNKGFFCQYRCMKALAVRPPSMARGCCVCMGSS